MRELHDLSSRISRSPTRGGAKFLALCLVISTAMSANAQSDHFVPSPEGYYEGSVRYSCNYLKNIGYASMILDDKADFWLTLTRSGHGTYVVNGQGTAIFDFSYAIDWTMGVKVGVSMLNVLGAKIDPKVTLTLDPKTAVQKFYLTGEISAEEAKNGGVKLKDVAVSWTPPNDEKAVKPKLKLQLVGSVSMDVSGSKSMDQDFGKGPGGTPIGKASGEGAIKGGTFNKGTVAQTIAFDPPPPFGSDKFTLVLRKRSRYGPFADEYDITAPGQGPGVEVMVHWATIQKIDFGWFRHSDQTAASGGVGAAGAAGRDGQSGSAGANGQDGAAGANGRDGAAGGKGDSGANGQNGRDGNNAAPNWRAGSVTAKIGQETRVTFSQPLPNADYVVSLTPARGPSSSWICNYSNKRPDGFTLRAELSNPADASTTTTQVDWLALPAQ